MQTIEQLVRSAQTGERAAFAELVRLYERAAIVTAHSVLGDFHAAQDAAQDGFVTAYQKIGSLREAAAFGPWLMQIVRRRALAVKQRVVAPPGTPAAETAAPAADTSWLAQYEEVLEHVGRLPDHEREVIVLRYVDGNSVAQIAGLTGRPLGTVTKQLSRAMERLKTWLIEVQS